MGSFGEKLRREREMRKISLDEIATATKIGTRSLKALEDENFAILPGGIFHKGFVRSYARFLGLNEDDAVADYQAAVIEQPVSVKTIAAQSAMAKASRLAAQQASESCNTAGIVRAVGLFLLAVAAAFGGYESVRHGYLKALKRPSLHHQLKQQAQNPVTPALSPAEKPPQTTVAVPAPQVAALPVATPPVASSSIQSAPVGAPATVPTEFTVSIKTSEESWLSVTADGRRAFQRLFAANEEQSVTAKSKIQIKIGNPNGTEISLNGKLLAISGSLAHPRTVTVDASGLANQ
jgi:cytoskeleton protein RodZ